MDVEAEAVPADDTLGPGPVRVADRDTTLRYLARMVADGFDEDEVLVGAIAVVSGYTIRMGAGD